MSDEEDFNVFEAFGEIPQLEGTLAALENLVALPIYTTTKNENKDD